MGDIMVGCVVLSFAMRRHGNIALLLAPAYIAGLFLAVFWSYTRKKPIPALVPIVPCMWVVLAMLEAWHTSLWGLFRCSRDGKEDVGDATEEETRSIVYSHSGTSYAR
jgi:hypothetical protein